MTASTQPAQRHPSARPKRTVDELHAIAREASERFADASADDVLTWAATEFGERLTVACSMADAVLPHVVSQHAPGVDVLFLDTGYHFAETISTRNAVAEALDITVVDVRPRLTVVEQDAEHGPRLHDRDPELCCWMRKVEPLAETLDGYEAWITGVRRDEGPTRANTPVVTWDETNDIVKINPLATWTQADLDAWADDNDLPTNPLISQGYPSIGCQPCTRPVAPGEDPRSGRWAGFAKTECGLHPGTTEES